jgi:hypothetical protein
MRRLGFVLLVALFGLGQSAVPQIVLTPNNGQAGSTVEVVANAQLSATGQISFEPGGLQATNLRSSRQGLQFTLQIGANAAPGNFTFVYVPPADNMRAVAPAPIRVPNAFTVTAPPPRVLIRSITPNEVMAGQPATAHTIAGSGFQQGAQVSIAGQGVTANVTGVSRAGDSLTVSVTAAPTAPPGPRNVTVFNPDQSSNASQLPAVQLTVLPPRKEDPVIDSITPSTFTAGQKDIAVQISGKGFQTGATLAVSGSGASLTNVVVASPTVINAAFSADPSAATGQRTVQVTNRDATSNAGQRPPATITIAAPAPTPVAPAPPVIRQITPDVCTAGTMNIAVTITGAGFQPGAQLNLSGSGASFSNVTVSNASQMMASLSGAGGAAPGPRNVGVINPDQSSNANQSPPPQITVQAPRVGPPPEIVQITPSSFTIGATNVPVVITGRNFQSSARLSVSGSDASFAGVRVLDSTRIQALVSVLPNVKPGPRTVILDHADGSTTANQTPPPSILLELPAQPVAEPPIVDSVTPDRMLLGGPAAMLQVRGKNFHQGATLTIAGLDVSVVSVAADGNSLVARAGLAQAAKAGTAPVILTNPDRQSNANQRPPVLFTIAAPATPPPTTPPPTTPPPTTPPPTTPPPTQPPTTPPPVEPPTVTPPLVRPPTETLLGPRIDLVTPSNVNPGGQYKLTLEGKNLSPDTKISFGKDVTIVGVPFFQSPTKATVDVIVSPAAGAGALPGVATNPRGSNSGPGGIYIAPKKTAVTPAPPAPVQQPPVVVQKTYKQPTGVIILDAPCDPDALLSQTCKTPVTLNDSTLFVWHELNPGIAKIFVFEIVDSEGKVLFAAQTPKTWFRLSAANLASLPRIEKAPSVPVKITTAKPGAAPQLPANVAPGDKSSGVMLAASQSASIKPGDTAALDAAMKTAGPHNVDMSGYVKALTVNRSPAAGEVYWRVRGIANRIHEYTGVKLAEMIEVEKSAERAIVLPLPPNGFSCDSGTAGTKVGAFVPEFFPTKFTYAEGKRPKPCPGNSMNICGLADFAVFSPDARIDLTRVPFDLRQVGTLGSSEEVTFQNVFVDWGDGTEPKPLKVKGKLTGGQSLKSLKLVRPGSDENARLRHLYVNKDQDAEFVVYKVRIFALADADKTPPHQVSSVSSGEAKPFGSLTMAGLGSQATPVSSAQKPAMSSPGAAVASPAAANVVANLTSRMFTIACQDVQVWNPWGAGADEPLHLLTADILFPTDGDEIRTLIKTQKFGVIQAPSLSLQPTAVSSPVGTRTPAQAPSPQSVTPKAPVQPAAPKAATPQPGQATVTLGSGQLHIPQGLPVPEISDCSSAFKAAVRLTYWGNGKIKLNWYLDDVLIETMALPSQLPPVSTADGEAGKKPYLVSMTGALPAVLQAAPHRLRVRVEVLPPTPLFVPVTIATAPLGPKVQAQSAAQPAKVTLGPSQYSYAQVNQTLTASVKPPSTPSSLAPAASQANAGLATFAVKVIIPEPGSQVDSPVRYYRVFDHKDRGLPCLLRFATAESGIFDISDLSTLTQTGDTYSGTGFLKLYFPAKDGESMSVQPVKINFSGWALSPMEEEGDDVLNVDSGTLEQAMNVPLEALNFPLKVQKIALAQQRLVIDGNVAVQVGMGLTNATVEELPRWEFTSTPLSADGDFHFTSSKAVQTEIGASKFVMKISSAEIDFSQTSGSAPTQPCAAAPEEAAAWRGIRLSGVMQAPDTLQFNNVALLKDYAFTGWGMGPGGLSIKFNDPEFTKQVSTSGVKIVASGFNFSVCGGTFGSPTFGIEISNAPLVIQTLKGKITLDEYASLHPSFPAVNINHDWGNVKGKITKATFGFSPQVANFAVMIDSHFSFLSKGKPVYDHAYDGILITLQGNVFAANGDNYFAVPDAGTANIGGYPMQVTALGVGNMPNGDMWFGFRGDIEAGTNAPQAKDREAKFKLTKKSASLIPDGSTYQLASLYGMALPPLYDQFDYSSSEKDGITVQEIDLDFAFPPSSKTVTVKAHCLWEESDGRFYFLGTGKVTVAESFGIDINALFGREASESYWMVKASLDFPSMIALGSTGFGMKKIHGGLGYSIPISSYDMADLKLVKPDKSKSYSFMAGIDVGTMDAFTIYCRGQLTVKIGGPDAGARLSVAAWLLTSTHTNPPMGEACMQYAGGSFDAGMTAHLETGGGLVVIDAPKSGPDVCKQAAIQIHFGGSEAWHIWIGQQALPITAKVIIIQGKGYLMIDGAGIESFVGAGLEKQWDVKIAGFTAYVRIDGGVEVQAWLTYGPFFVKGQMTGWVNAKAGAKIAGGCCSVSFGLNLMFSAEAPPVAVCGKVKVSFSPPWPIPDVSATVGPLCLGG